MSAEAVAEATAGLASVHKQDVIEVRSFAKPPAAVQRVFECVAILKGHKDTSWKGICAMMADAGFLASLQAFDKDSVTDKQAKELKAYFKDKDFTAEKLAAISRAAEKIFIWAKALFDYHESKAA